jgi:hypothetical protein
MIKNDKVINSLMYGDAVEKLIKERNINITEARAIISEMSFSDYCNLVEASADIIPPSGKPLSPSVQPGQQSQPAATAPQKTPAASAKPGADPRGVQVRNPATGKMEWMQPTEPVAEDEELNRMKKLAGIKENASCGATAAGSIASAPTSTGSVKRRQPTYEQPKEYTPKEAPKTIVGDTKPGQASGELSSNLAVRGKKTASRTNNGFKK